MNPLILQAFRYSIPYAITFALGFCAAWYVQGLRVTSAKQELVEYRQEAKQKLLDEKERHQKINEEARDGWIASIDVLHQCYKSGRCRVPAQPGGMPSGGISAPASGADAGALDAVPAPTRVAEDCAEETLRLIRLQSWIEKVSEPRR